MKVDQLINLIYSGYKLDPEGAIKKLKKSRKTYMLLTLVFFIALVFCLFLAAYFGRTIRPLFLCMFLGNVFFMSMYVADLFKIVKAIKTIQSLIDNRGGSR